MINKGIAQVVLCHSKDNVATAKAVLRTGTLLSCLGERKSRPERRSLSPTRLPSGESPGEKP